MPHQENLAPLNLRKDGAQRYHGAVLHDLLELRLALAHLPSGQAGIRLSGIEALRRFLRPDGSIGSVAAGVLGPASRPVRAVLFDKTAETNWSLAWHQDRTI